MKFRKLFKGLVLVVALTLISSSFSLQSFSYTGTWSNCGGAYAFSEQDYNWICIKKEGNRPYSEIITKNLSETYSNGGLIEWNWRLKHTDGGRPDIQIQYIKIRNGTFNDAGVSDVQMNDWFRPAEGILCKAGRTSTQPIFSDFNVSVTGKYRFGYFPVHYYSGANEDTCKTKYERYTSVYFYNTDEIWALNADAGTPRNEAEYTSASWATYVAARDQALWLTNFWVNPGFDINTHSGEFRYLIENFAAWKADYNNAVAGLERPTYSIAFNGNGATAGSTASMPCAYGMTYTLNSNGFSRTGHIFAGWATSPTGDVVYTNQQTGITNLSITGGTITLFAKWTSNTYNVQFEGNGSTGGSTLSPQTFSFDVPQNLNTNGFTRAGYTFAGWATSVDGAVFYADAQNVTNVLGGTTQGATVTLYAKWMPYTYSVTYDAGATSGVSGGDLMTPSAGTFDVPLPLRTNTFNRTGYTFTGWGTTLGGGVQYIDEDTVNNLSLVNGGSVTLYAQWTANQYTVHYNNNGGSGTMANSNHTYDSPKNLMSNNFYKTGYEFAGWNTAANGSGTGYANTQSVLNLAQSGTFNLYAMWTPIIYYINYNPNTGTGMMENSTHSYGIDSNLTANAYTKIGHTFMGWNTAADGSGTGYTDGQSVIDITPNLNEVVTFYAVWQINRYTVNFNLNGGIGVAPLAVTQNYATPITLPPTAGVIAWPVTVGTTSVRFCRGWNTTTNADEKLTGYTVPDADSTLYAVWGADYTAVLNASNTAGTDYLPAANDPRYLPGGDLYASAGFTHGGIYPRSDFTWASVGSLESAVQAVNFTNKKSEQDTLVKGYETAIMTAYGNLVLAPADYSTLEGLILDATTGLNRALYTSDSLVAVDEERANAEESVSKGYKKPLQYRVDERSIALENALNSLVFRGADYSEVIYIWTNRPAFTNYTDESVYNLTYYYEQEVNTTLLISDQAIVDGYADTLIELINALVLKDADYTGVHAALLAIPDMDFDEYFDQAYLETIYSTTSVANLAEKVNAVVWGKNITAQLVVDGYAQAIVTATNALAPKNANYYYLGVALGRAPLLPVDYYTAVSYQFYLNKLNAGQNLYDHQTLTILQQAIINQATDDINTAYGALTPKTVNYTVKYQTTGGAPLAIDAVKTGLAGSQVTETAAEVTGYTPVQTTMQSDLTGTSSENVIIFTYSINSYSLTYDANGGTGGTGPTSTVYGTALSAPAVTRTGYAFDGWSPAVDETMPAGDTVYTAQWVIAAVTITFDANGGTGGWSQDLLIGVSLTAPVVTRTGYTFDGWDPVVPETVPGEATTYTAEWTMIPVLVVAEGSTTIINSESNFIYGLEPGISQADFEDLFVEVLGNGRLVITSYSEFGEFGTGTKVELLDNATDEVVATYYIVIFGDVNGDGFVSTIDGDIVFNVDNWYIEWDIETQPFLFAAADLNGDGFVSTIDGDIIFNVDNWYMYIDQTTGLAYEAENL